jgi:hypothetical protein
MINRVSGALNLSGVDFRGRVCVEVHWGIPVVAGSSGADRYRHLRGWQSISQAPGGFHIIDLKLFG